MMLLRCSWLLVLLAAAAVGPMAQAPDAAPAGLTSTGNAATAAAAPDGPTPADSGSVPEIRDPFYAFILEITAVDSLGAWTRDDLQAYVARSGRPTRMPLDRLRHISRRAAAGPESEIQRGAQVFRIWEIALEDDLRLPMPYSILGYHPGHLLISRDLKFSEWRLDRRNIHVVRGDTVAVIPARQVTAFRLDEGWVILDVAAVIDRVLGAKLDDSWTVGFAVCRVEDRLCGLGLGYSRSFRKLFGEIDFRSDEILAHGRPLARGFSSFVRPWLDPPEGVPGRIWRHRK
jgi:hypothetical protein